MGNKNEEQVSDDKLQVGFGSRLQIVMSFIKRLIDQFRVTQQDLSDAGVYFRRMYD